MQHLEVSCAVRPIQWPLGVKWLITDITCSMFLGPDKQLQVSECPVAGRSVTSEDNVFKTSGWLRITSVSCVLCTMFRNIKIYLPLTNLRAPKLCIPDHTPNFYSDAFRHLLMPSSGIHSTPIFFSAHLYSDFTGKAG